MGIWLRSANSHLLDSILLADWIHSGAVQGVAALSLLDADGEALPRRALRVVRPAAHAGRSDMDVLDRWVTGIVRAFADLFLPIYEGTSGDAGYVSFDLYPVGDARPADLLEAVRRLWARVNRPNAMIRMPAGEAGLQALEASTTEGINIHLFGVASVERYAEAAAAYQRGLAARLQQGLAINHLASVVSVDVARWSAYMCRRVRELPSYEAGTADRRRSLEDRVGWAFARLILAQQRAAFAGAGFTAFASRGAHPQWAVMTGIEGEIPRSEAGIRRDGALPDDILLGVDAPVVAGISAGEMGPPRLDGDLSASRAELSALEERGLGLADVERGIEAEIVAEMRREERRLMTAIRRGIRLAGQELGPLRAGVEAMLDQLIRDDVVSRLWKRDVALWAPGGPGADEAARRQGWLTLPDAALSRVPDLRRMVDSVHGEGWTDVVLMGMGGSSLASDVIRRTLATQATGLRLHVLDTTDPDAVRWVTRRAPLRSTLFLVSSKSGTTAEPLALLSHFWALLEQEIGDAAGSHFIALTDPDTPLQALAQDRGFREVVHTPPDVGGRFSALSPFGLLPAALMGVDVLDLTRGGSHMARACGPGVDASNNPGLHLGAVLGTAARQGRDKLTILADPGLEPLGDWIEQLIAESTGKEGKGVLPVVGEPPGAGRVYGSDRLLVYLRLNGSLDGRARGWIRAGVPVCILEADPHAAGLGSEFFRWEFATAVACHILGVNAFNQPDVQRAKTRTVELLKVHRRAGSFPEPPVVWQDPSLAIRGDRQTLSLDGPESRPEVMRQLLDKVRPDESLVLLLYVRSTGALDRAAATLRRRLRDQRGWPVTVGYGPRYLHSTGQLHKGGPDNMVFLVVTCDPAADLPVPEAGYSFGTLERAQAVGDLQALLGLGRRAFGLHVGSPSDVRALLAEIGRAG
jgi:transaldolase/glucose-6-phosphate isomerase